jgi:hypothetical protein
MSFTGERGRQGKALIIAGVIIWAADVALVFGIYAWGRSHGDNLYGWSPNFWRYILPRFIPTAVIALGVTMIGRGVRQARRARNSIGGPGQEIPPPGHGYRQPAPDWYSDPWDPSLLRWWVGTHRRRPARSRCSSRIASPRSGWPT